MAFRSDDGCLDFVTDLHVQEERAHYDAEYRTGGWTTQESLDTVNLDRLWRLDVSSRDYLVSFGNVAGKRILLIGNGTSIKELIFLKNGAEVMFTDLSLEAVKFVRRRFFASAFGKHHSSRCQFHAVDMLHLPFADRSFDIVCADAVIHHVEELDVLMAGIQRVLKPGGICRFADTAYSPGWQAAKRGLLRPLQKKVHHAHGISPEDLLATERGGYTRAELEALRKRLGFDNLYFQKVALVDYLVWRGHCNLGWRWILAFRPLARGLDRILQWVGLMQRHGIALILGFQKSGREVTPPG